MGVIVVF